MCIHSFIAIHENHLDVRTDERAVAIIGKYYPLNRFPQKTMYALEELLPKGS